MADEWRRLAARMDGVSESATLRLNALVQSLKAQGQDIINLTAGEPDFGVQEEANQAVRDALLAQKSKYTPAAGIPELRAAIAAKTSAQQPSLEPWKGAHVVVSNGGKQALFNALQVLVNPGEEVLIPAPFWLSYPEMAKLAGGKPVILPTRREDGFALTPAVLREALRGGRARVLILNSPSNPTGAMLSREQMVALGEVIQSTPEASKLIVISDEIYDRIVFGEVPFCSFAEACPALRDRVITVNGMSKSHAMTGWRIGWSVASEWVTSALITLQGQSTSGINALAQAAALRSLELPESRFTGQVDAYRKRRDLMVQGLSARPGYEVFRPQGAFYLWVGVRSLLQAGEDSMGFCERLLRGARVAAVPGTPFGAADSIRLSFASDEATLQRAVERMVAFAG
jgi:aspartate aminotransferase